MVDERLLVEGLEARKMFASFANVNL